MRRKSIFLILMSFILGFSLLTFTACAGDKDNGNGNNGNESSTYKIEFMIDSSVYHTINTSGNEVLVFPQNPSKNGYTFDGWFYDEGVFENELTQTTYSTKALTSDVRVYAKFNLETYTITYENTKGVENTNVESYTINSAAIVLKGLALDGYIFDGWYNGNVKVTEIASGTTGNLTLTARWTEVQYKITYKNIDGATNNNQLMFTISDLPLKLVDAEKSGYEFMGWYGEITEIDAKNLKDLEVFAKWEIITYYATFVADGKQVGEKIAFTVENMNITEPMVPSKAGYTGKWEDYTLTLADITIYAQWDIETFNINYENTKGAKNTNANTYTIETEAFTIENLSLNGYNFDGWFTDKDYTMVADTAINKGSVGEKTFYAKWSMIIYTLDMIDYGGTYEDDGNITTYTIEDEVILKNPTLEGYVFDGWYTLAEGGEKVTKIAIGTTGNLTFHARYKQMSTISFVSNGGSAVSNIVKIEGESITAPENPTKDYYDFAGWYMDSEHTNKYTFSVMPKDSITLYAKWTPTIYSITYVLYDGENDEDNLSTYTVETPTFTINNATRYGYLFDGWYENSTNSEIKFIAKGSYGNLILIAKWLSLEDELSIVYNYDDSGYYSYDKYNDEKYETYTKTSFRYKEERYKNEVGLTNYMPEVYYFGDASELQSIGKAYDEYISEGFKINTSYSFSELELNILYYRLIQKGEFGYMDDLHPTYYRYSSIPYDMTNSNYEIYVFDNNVTAAEKATYDSLYYVHTIKSDEITKDQNNIVTKDGYVDTSGCFYVQVPYSTDRSYGDVYFKKLFSNISETEYNNIVSLFTDEGVSKIYFRISYSAYTLTQRIVYIDENEYDDFICNNPNYSFPIKLVRSNELYSNADYKLIPSSYIRYYNNDFDLYFKICYDSAINGIIHKSEDVFYGEYETKNIPMNLGGNVNFIQNLITGSNAIFIIDDSLTSTDKRTYKDLNYTAITTDEFNKNKDFYVLINETDLNYNSSYSKLYYRLDIQKKSVREIFILSSETSENLPYSKIDPPTFNLVEYEFINRYDPNYVEGLELFYKRIIYTENYIDKPESNDYLSFIYKYSFIKNNQYKISIKIKTNGFCIDKEQLTKENLVTSIYISNDNFVYDIELRDINTNNEYLEFSTIINVDKVDFHDLNFSIFVGSKENNLVNNCYVKGEIIVDISIDKV